MSAAQVDPWGPSAKAWSTRQARCRIHGGTAFRSDPDDGTPRYFVAFENRTVAMFLDLDALDVFLDSADAAVNARFASVHAEAAARDRSSVLARSDAERGP